MTIERIESVSIRVILLASLLLLAPIAAHAATLSASDQASLAGEWKERCGAQADGSELRLTFEFAVSGGSVAMDDGTEGAGEYKILSATANNARVTFDLQDQGRLGFVRQGKALKATDGDVSGKIFTRCQSPADRSVLKLDHKQLEFLSVAVAPDYAIFIDTRVKLGCKAIAYQYLSMDLVGPTGFSMARANSWALGEKLAEGKIKTTPYDEVSNFIVESAGVLNGQYRLKLTELIPPNGSRGDTATITIIPGAGGTVSIPEWKRSYKRCTRADLAAQ